MSTSMTMTSMSTSMIMMTEGSRHVQMFSQRGSELEIACEGHGSCNVSPDCSAGKNNVVNLVEISKIKRASAWCVRVCSYPVLVMSLSVTTTQHN